MFNSLKKTIAQNKVVAGVSASVLATASQAAVTVDGTTGYLSGDIDTGMYASGIPIVIGFIAFTLGVTAVIALVRKAKP